MYLKKKNLNVSYFVNYLFSFKKKIEVKIKNSKIGI